jgi:hypothetical protein
MTISPSFITRLRKVAAPSTVPAVELEQCDFCGNEIPPEHRHFVDLNEMRFLCTCEMCAVVQAESGIYKPLPQRCLHLEDFDMPEQLWQEFLIPVNMAFFVKNTARASTVAFYPAPAGATESKLKLEAWEKLAALNPILDDLTPDLEALLVNRLDLPPYEYYLVPIDSCYHLIGLIRSVWSGLYGGPEVQTATRQFFEELKLKSTRCPT